MKERFRTLSAVMILLCRTNQQGQEEVLLQKRMNTGFMDGYWDFSASGHVENNESMKMAAVREAKEELGVDVKIENLEFMCLLHEKTPVTEQIYYNGYLKTTKWTNEPRVNEPDKCEEIKWFLLDKLPENMVGCRRQAIENDKNHIPYAEYGWDIVGDNHETV